MRGFCSCLAGLMLGCGVASGKGRLPWVCYVAPPQGAAFEIPVQTQDSYTMTIKRTDTSIARSWALAIVNVDRQMWTQNKLVFSVRGLNGKRVTFTPTVSYVSGKKVVMKSAKSFEVAGRTWRDYVLGLDSDFGLGDTGLMFKQIKLGVDVTHWKEGDEGGVEVKNVRMCAPSEVTLSSGGARTGEFFAVPGRPEVVKPVKANALRVYFSFDNEDVVKSISTRKKGLLDEQQYYGFRETMLEQLGGAAVVETDLADADIIVYSRCRPDDAEASAIAAAVQERGIPLLAASEIADAAVSALLPCELKARTSEDYPERLPLSFVDGNHSLAQRGGYSTVGFGKYRDIKAKADSSVVMTFSDGTPAVVEGRAGKGRVLYSMIGIGSSVVPQKASPDAFFVRLLGYLSDRKLPEKAAPAVKPDADGWYMGASENNFGRFGWEIGSGLLVESLGRHLAITKGVCEYEFSEERKAKITVPNWVYTGLDKTSRKQAWNTSWQDIGIVSLASSVKIPSIWRGKRIFFHVEKGIDDTAEVYINGNKIGEITQATPHYWEVTHKHLIPEGIIRFDQENEIRIVTENLRGSGSFGSCPEIVLEVAVKNVDFAADRCNHLGLGGTIMVDGKRLGRMDASLAFPGTRWQFDSSSINMSLYNVLGYAAIPTASGVKVLALENLTELPVDWSEPWLLLYTGESPSSPLLVVFQRKMKSVEVVRNGDSINGLSFTVGSGAIGSIVPTWLFGSRPIDSSSWKTALPADVLRRIAFWYPRAQIFPEQAVEEFRLNTKTKRTEIRNTYTYLETRDEWGTKLVPYAPVPPLAYYTHDFFTAEEQAAGKLLYASADGVEARDLPTNFGPYADKAGSNRVHWSLPLPEPDLSLLPHAKGFDRYVDIANAQFKSGVRFSCGGGVKVENHNKAYPRGKGEKGVINLNMHGSLLGMCRCTPNPFIYTPENRRLMRRRMLWRMLEPLETHQYKMVCRWRQEPFSGIRYTIYMNSPRDIVTSYRPETYGSKIIYGDSNETVRMIFTCIQKLADQMGQYDVVKANWDALKRHVATYPLVLDDWGYLASGCLEYGGACSIDMLNNEYASLCVLARLAEIVGDEPVRQQALYRAARRMVPTLARLRIKDYYVANGMLSNPDHWSISTGFGEGGAVFRQKGAPVRDVELLDMSQGIPQDLINLYNWFGWNELQRNYLDDVYKSDGTRGMTYIMASMLAIGGDQTNEQIMEYLDACTKVERLNKWLPTDWPGMDTGSYLEYIFHRMTNSPVISDCRDCHLHDAVYEPKLKELTLDYTPGSKARLAIKTDMKLKPGSGLRRQADGTILLPVKKTERQTIKIVLE